MDKPVLSIGIIFRNDIRCIERCLKALQPLRDAVPSELVMADTGSNDGSRAVAEKYADIMFDFPWINDFAAARNSVLDRCTGEWFLSVDTDEYLDEDISELVDFLRTDNSTLNLCRVNIRSYQSYEMDGSYSDFFTLRLVRLSIGARYFGAIHEAWTGIDHRGPLFQFTKTVFHHDGYVNMEQNTEKLERNMSLLRQKIKKAPQDLLIRLQIIESGIKEADYLEQLRKAVTLVKRKPERWESFGPPILRHAVSAARDRKLPEFEKWADMAEEWFPDSYYTRIDVAAHRMTAAYDKGEYGECVRRSRMLLAAYADYRAGRGDLNCQAYSTLQLASPYYEQLFRLMAAVACLEEGIYEEAQSHLTDLDYSQLNGEQTGNLAKALCALRSKSELNTDELILSVWEGITAPKPSEKRAGERRLTFLLVGSSAFTPNYCREETRKGQCHAYPLFAPLAGKCGLGTAAAIMGTEDPAKIAALLSTVDKWNELPFPAVSHAIKQGVPFPLPDKPLDVETMAGIAKRLAGDWKTLFSLLEGISMENAAGQTLAWNQAMVVAALRACTWRDKAQGSKMARLFAGMEKVFLSRYYAPEMLRRENVTLLPAMHRFGWHCVQAFDALDAGDAVGYARRLREGLTSVEGMKPMVEFLLENTPELQVQKPPPSGELLALAEQVRIMLAAYPADDPAVVIIKQSAAYQKVAHLIEGPEAGVFGGLPQ